LILAPLGALSEKPPLQAVWLSGGSVSPAGIPGRKEFDRFYQANVSKNNQGFCLYRPKAGFLSCSLDEAGGAGRVAPQKLTITATVVQTVLPYNEADENGEQA